MTCRNLRSILLVTSAALMFCAASLFAQTPAFVSFDAPDAGTGPGQGTVALYINQVGVAVGHYSDSSNLQHGFLRLPNGQITEFDPPNLTSTNPTAINIHGQIVGSGALNHLHFHGFLRNPNGVYAHIDPPGTVVSSPMAINDSGQITGFFQDATDSHGFLRNTDGTYVIFDAPGGSNITPLSINNSGAITGYYSAPDGSINHSFVRDASGNFTSFDFPGATSSGTLASSINAGGQITGIYSPTGQGSHSFLRDALGNISNADAPGVDSTSASTINDAGVIVGQIAKGSKSVGYRDASGSFTSIQLPVANLSSTVNASTNAGLMVGTYTDPSLVTHGFLK